MWPFSLHSLLNQWCFLLMNCLRHKVNLETFHIMSQLRGWVRISQSTVSISGLCIRFPPDMEKDISIQVGRSRAELLTEKEGSSSSLGGPHFSTAFWRLRYGLLIFSANAVRSFFLYNFPSAQFCRYTAITQSSGNPASGDKDRTLTSRWWHLVLALFKRESRQACALSSAIWLPEFICLSNVTSSSGSTVRAGLIYKSKTYSKKLTFCVATWAQTQQNFPRIGVVSSLGLV